MVVVVVGQPMLAPFALTVVEVMPRFGKSLGVWQLHPIPIPLGELESV